MGVHSKTCWAWDAIDDLQEPEIGEQDVRAAEACAQLTFVPAAAPTSSDHDSRTSSGKVDIRALLRTARAPTERTRREWPAPRIASRERIARTSTPEHVRHARRRSFVRGALIGGTVMAAVALGPAMVSIARAPHASRVDGGPMEPVSVVVVDRRKTSRSIRDGAPPTLTQLVITRAAAPLPSPATTADDPDRANPQQPSTRANTGDADELAPPRSRRGAASPDLELANTATAVETASHDTDTPASAVITVDHATLATETMATETMATPTEIATTTVDDPLRAATAAPLEPTSAPVASSDSPSPPTLDRLIEDAVGLPRVTPASEMPPAPPAPAPVTTPTRDEVDRALASARVRVAECAAEGHGLANVRITIAGSTGRVMSAVVEGALAGTPAGSCVARAVRRATFPPFAQPTFTVQYPFQL